MFASATTEEGDVNPAASEPARVVVVTSGKGGVGKTTSTANIGMSVARLGYRVALIDADIGLRNLDLLLGLENRVMFTAMEVLDGECRLEQARVLPCTHAAQLARSRSTLALVRAALCRACATFLRRAAPCVVSAAAERVKGFRAALRGRCRTARTARAPGIRPHTTELVPRSARGYAWPFQTTRQRLTHAPAISCAGAHPRQALA